MHKPRFADAEFQGDVGDAVRAVKDLQLSPDSVSAYRAACTAIRHAKLLFLALRRSAAGVDPRSTSLLLQAANDAVYTARHYSTEIPIDMRVAFDQVSNSLNRHLEDLKSMH